MVNSKFILPIIVIAQFFCTSLWFAGNGVVGDIMIAFNLEMSALGNLTSFVQFGFIVGTLVFAFLALADRYSPAKIFLLSAVFGATFNACIIWSGNTLTSILVFRFLTGFCLAGIYPVGMKIAACYFDKDLGKALGLLIGALVLGTALPHLLNEVLGMSGFPWQGVILSTSALAIIGGLMIYFLVPDGPFCMPITKLNIPALLRIFKLPDFRSSAFGYFGHMWELYSFWTFLPLILSMYMRIHVDSTLSISLFSFLIIAIGALGCVLSAILSQYFNTKRIAFVALLISGTCCLIFPLMFQVQSSAAFLCFLFIWGLTIPADAPMLSTCVSKSVPVSLKGSALTLVNSIGFFVSIVSIEIINANVTEVTSTKIFLILAIGPILGLISIVQNRYAPNA